jgi:predicted thioredoxin/glutaredoxin
MVVLQFYTRQGCHLCELTLEKLQPLVKGRAKIEMRDIDTNAAWLEKYDVRVPVVECDGQIITEYPLDHAAIAQFLAEIGILRR